MPPHPPITPIQSDYIRDNYLTKDDEAIATHLKVSKKRVLIWRKELGYLKESGWPRVKPVEEYYFNWSVAGRLDFIVNNQ